MLLCALALFAKTTACTVPAALVLVLWLRNEKLDRTRILQIMPFLFLGVGMGLVSVWWEKHLGDAQAESGAAYGWVERLLIATRALWFYAGTLVWPANLTFTYPKWAINAQAAGQYIWLAAGGVLGAGVWWKRKALGRGIIAGLVFFVAALSPLLGSIWLYTFRYSFVADHYQYLACLGLIGPIVAVAACLSANWPLPARVGVSSLVLLSLGVLTWRQCATYTNEETLWRTTIERNPAAWMAHLNLGNVMLNQGRGTEAVLQ